MALLQEAEALKIITTLVVAALEECWKAQILQIRMKLALHIKLLLALEAKVVATIKFLLAPILHLGLRAL
jgi:hypothetical protein